MYMENALYKNIINIIKQNSNLSKFLNNLIENKLFALGPLCLRNVI